MELAIMFVPFILAMGLYCANDPLTRRFMEDWENDHARRYKAHRR